MVHRFLPFVMLAFIGTSLQPNRSLQQSSTPQQSIATLHANTRLVVVDVVVHDKNGQPVHGLKAEDFTLLEGGAAQTFKGFEEHTAPTDAELAKIPALAKLPPGTFTNFSTAVTPDDRPLNILLLDRLNTPVGDQAQMQKQINEYLASSRKGARMAIFGLTDRLVLLQGFTDDPELLRAAVVEGGYYTSPLREQRMGGEGNGESLKSSEILAIGASGMGNSPKEVAGMVAGLKAIEEMTTAFQTLQRAQRSLDALNALARYLAALPGRKNLIWFSGAFPLDILPDINANNPSALVANNGKPTLAQPSYLGNVSKDKEFRETEEELSRSRVSVYPIDAKGLNSMGAYSAANVATSTGLSGRPTVMKNSTLDEQINTFQEETVDEHVMMYAIASDTGGKAAVATNGLKEALESAMADGANYYTIAYEPANTNWNGDLRKIEVKVKEGNYSLSYRKGYFADDPNALGSAKTELASGAASVSHAMLLALAHGGPEPTQIVFTASVLPVSAETESTAAPNNKLGNGAKAPYRRYRVDYDIDPRAVHFTQGQDGNRHETLEFVIHVYDSEGQLVDSVGTSIKTTVTPAQYEQFVQLGIPYRQEVSVPAKGEYSLRIAMRDVEADLVGAIELPVASVSGLQPLEAAAQ